MALMRHTRRSDEWIRTMAAKFPLREKAGTDGKPTGIFDSGLTRFSYPHLLVPSGDKNDKTKEPWYSVGVWFTPLSDLRPLYGSALTTIAAYKRIAPEAVASTITPGRVPDKIAGIATPFHDQAEKGDKDGYTPGCMYLNAKCDIKHKPSVMCMRGGVRTHMTAEEDRLIYGGMWGIVTFRLYMIDAVTQGPNPYPARLCCGLLGAFILGGDTAIGTTRLDADAHYGSIDGGEDIGDMGGVPAGFDGGAGVPGSGAFNQGFDWSQPQAQPVAAQWTPEQIAFRRSMGLPG